MVKIVDKHSKWDKIVKNSEPLKKGPVVGVGYPENKVENSVIQYAAYNHFGVFNFSSGKKPERIPPRPFLAVTIDTNKAKIFNLKKKLGAQLLAGQITPDKALNILGAAVTGMVKQTLSGSFFQQNVPNALSTIKIKGSSKPLINHGIMRNSTTWQVFPNGKPE